VTLSGQSAGGTSIRAHMISPISHGLFSQIIIQSDPYSLPMRDLDDASSFGTDYAKALGCTSLPNMLSCLQSKSVDDLLVAQKQVEKEINIFRPIEIFLPFTPVVDGSIVPAHFFDAVAAGKFAKVPMIIGSVSEDALLFVYKGLNSSLSTAAYEGIIAAIFLLDTIDVTETYPPKPLFGDKRPQLSILGTDYIFTCPTRNIASSIISSSSSSSIYIYQWDHALSFDGWGPRFPYCVGHVCHAAELPYLFAPSVLSKVGNFTPDEKVLSASIMNYWANFAKTGNPNQGSQTPPRVNWPSWNPSTLSSIRFATPQNQIVNGLQKQLCDFWDVIGYHHGW